jgi:hypothetical protein
MMRKNLFFILIIVLQFGCKNIQEPKFSEDSNDMITIANEFVDAFYSFNSETLASVLSEAKISQSEILYYQKWAECGNYKVLNRAMAYKENDSTIVCPVTVKDDLMAALDIEFNVTDTFRLTIRRGQIRSVSTSSNDPDLYYAAKDWVKENKNDLIEVPCEGIWEGGPTPCDCIKGMIKGFGEFKLTE